MLPLQYSKEYQVVIKNEIFTPSREAGIQQLQSELNQIIKNEDIKIDLSTALLKEKWIRKYNTASHSLSESNLRITVEQYQQDKNIKSRIKMKYDCMDQDLCFDTKKYTDSFVYPHKKFKDRAKMKLEGDIHQNYEKYALSCAIKLDKEINLEKLADAEKYFKRLDHIKNADLNDSLIIASEFIEYSYEDIAIHIADTILSATLIIRYTDKALTPSLVELSFKVKREKAQWDYSLLMQTGQFYAELLTIESNFWKDRLKPFYFIRPAEQC
jgi:hypothetical protein